MEQKMEIVISLPEGWCEEAGINEDTAFETYFDGRNIHIRTVSEEELADIF